MSRACCVSCNFTGLWTWRCRTPRPPYSSPPGCRLRACLPCASIPGQLRWGDWRGILRPSWWWPVLWGLQAWLRSGRRPRRVRRFFLRTKRPWSVPGVFWWRSARRRAPRCYPSTASTTPSFSVSGSDTDASRSPLRSSGFFSPPRVAPSAPGQHRPFGRPPWLRRLSIQTGLWGRRSR